MPNSQFAQPFEILSNEEVSENFFLIKGFSHWNTDLCFSPGQYLMVDGFIGNDYLRRSYSPFLDEHKNICLLIQRNIKGLFSSLVEKSKTGDIIRISAPTGKDKSVSADIKEIIFLAFDNGISFPLNLFSFQKINISSKIYWQSEKFQFSEIELMKAKFFDNKTVIFEPDINSLAEQMKNITTQDTVFYLSGNGQKILFFEKVLRSLGVKNERIMHEIYFNHKLEPMKEWLETVKI